MHNLIHHVSELLREVDWRLVARVALAVLLGGLANKCWGMGEEKWLGITAGTRWQYVLLFTLACIIAQPSFTLWSPLIAAMSYGVRFMGTGEGWLAYESGMNRMKAITRGWPYLIFAAVLTAIDNDQYRIFVGFAFPICAAFYRYSGKYEPGKATDIAELLVGFYALTIVAA